MYPFVALLATTMNELITEKNIRISLKKSLIFLIVNLFFAGMLLVNPII